jgi:hypothetical protein
MRAVPAITSTLGAGLNDVAAASCLYKDGAHDGDGIVYQDAYTLNFNYAAVLMQTSEVSDDPNLIAGAAGALNASVALNASAVAKSSAASRTGLFDRRSGVVLGAELMGLSLATVATSLLLAHVCEMGPWLG